MSGLDGDDLDRHCFVGDELPKVAPWPLHREGLIDRASAIRWWPDTAHRVRHRVLPVAGSCQYAGHSRQNMSPSRRLSCPTRRARAGPRAIPFSGHESDTTAPRSCLLGHPRQVTRTRRRRPLHLLEDGRWLLRSVVALLLTGKLLVVLGSAAEADEIYARPSDGVFHLTGHASGTDGGCPSGVPKVQP